MPNDIAKLRRLMRTAHYINANHPANGNWSFALRSAWWFESFRDALSNGFARFTYYKKNYEIRHALGTRSLSLIPTDKLPKGQMEINEWEDLVKSIPYFDLDKREWRSFSVLNFIKLEEVWIFNNPGTSSRQTGGVASAEKG